MGDNKQRPPEEAPSVELEEAQAVLARLARFFQLPESATPRPADEPNVEETTQARDLEAKYQTLIEQIPAVVFMAFFDKGIGEAYVSPQIEALLGFTQEEWLNDPVRWYNQIHPEDKSRWSAEAAQMFLSGEPLRSIYRVIARDGRVVWFHCEAKMVRAEDGRPWFIHGVAFDITELKSTEAALKKAQDELEERVRQRTAELAATNQELQLEIAERRRAEADRRESDERYRDLVENARDIIYSHDLQGNYTSINKFGEQLTGYNREEALKLNLTQTVAPEYVEKARQMIASKLAGDTETIYDLVIMAKDGRRIAIEVNTRLVYRDGVPVGVQGIARDVTERKLLEDQLRQAQKVEAIGQLAGGIAHDFNNLLTAINGYSDLILMELRDEDPLRLNLEEIKRAGVRAASLTRQLLAFSRKQLLQPKVLDLNAVVADLEKMLRRLIGEDIELRTALSPGLGNTKADPGQIEQVIVNLAVNSRDAMPQGGHLTIETGNVELDESYAHEHVQVTSGAYVMLAVSDTGTGMDHETRAKIFEPFFTTKGVGKGTGLGLSTVYGIVKQSGGHIWVYSEPGQGTSFKIYLPRIAGDAEPLASASTLIMPMRGEETILLVEDEESVRHLAVSILKMNGYTVLEASNGDEALRLAHDARHDIALLLTDVVMPGVSGRALANQIGVMRPGIKVVYMSGYTDDAITDHGVLDPGIAFIQKPFTPFGLVSKVREVMDKPSEP